MGNEFRVNSFTNGWQSNPDITSFADGSYLIVWDSYVQAPTFTSYVVFGQRYSATGAPIGQDFIINGFENTSSRRPSITTLSDGGFVVSYTKGAPSVLDPTNIYFTVYNANGTVRNVSTQVDSVQVFESDTPDVVSLANGGFMIFFMADTINNGTKSNEIYARIYDANGTALGANFLVNTVVGNSRQVVPTAVNLTNGNIMIVWHSDGSLVIPGSLNSNELRGSIYSSTGQLIRADYSLLDAFGLVGDGVRDFDVAALAGGGFAVTFYGVTVTSGQPTTYETRMQLFDAAGNITSPIFTPVKSTSGLIYSSSVVQLETGEILIVWETPASTSFTTYLSDVRGQLFDLNGNALSPVFEVAQDRIDQQEEPVAVALAGGGFVVTYESEAIDPDADGIAAREFGRGGTAGNDTINVDVTGSASGLGGDDFLFGTAAGNTLSGGEGNDRLWGGLGADRLFGGNGDDIILAGDASTPTAADGADIAYGGAGADLLWGYAGDDQLYGGDGDDAIVGNDYASAVLGRDTIFGEAGNDTMFVGLGGSAYMDGGSGNDKFYGGSGDDTLRGGTGDDFLYGAGGADLFQFYRQDLAAGDKDAVYFVNAGDRLQFSASLNGALVFQDLASLRYDEDPTHFTTGVYITAFLGGDATSIITVYGTTVAALMSSVDYTL